MEGQEHLVKLCGVSRGADYPRHCGAGRFGEGEGGEGEDAGTRASLYKFEEQLLVQYAPDAQVVQETTRMPIPSGVKIPACVLVHRIWTARVGKREFWRFLFFV